MIFLSSVLGAIFGLVLEVNHERNLVAQAKAEGWTPQDIGDGTLFFLFIGTTAGFFLGVAAGSFWFVKVKAEAKEIQHIILKK
jgi:hypothetical protein